MPQIASSQLIKMEFQKENALKKSKKTITCCQACWEGSVTCKKCNGNCIFSKRFFQTCQYKKALKSQLESDFFKPEFDSIENLLEEPEQVFQSRYELLQQFHKDPSKYKEILRDHHIRELQSLKTRSIHQVDVSKGKHVFKGRCFWHRTAFAGKWYDTFGIAHKETSKQNKKEELLRFHQDFVI